MRRCVGRTLFVVGITIAILDAALPVASEPGAASWDEQICQPLYLLYQISTINVIVGLDLTREQAERLCALAREVEESSPAYPAFDSKQAGLFSTVVTVNLELRDVLLHGETPSQELRNKVIGARMAEAGLIRRSLLAEWRAKPQGTCAQCHVRPEDHFGAVSNTIAHDGARFDEKERTRAHMELVVGKKTMAAVWQRMDQVDKILTGFQKGAFEDFSCCLLPPDLSGGGLKIGQAENPSKMMDILNEARAAEASDWPAVKKRILSRLTARDRALHPRRSPEQEKQATEQLAATLQRAREMSEVDFMINKNQLCSQLEPARAKTSNPRLLRFKTAFFLLLPGSVRAYNAYLERLEKKNLAQTSHPSIR